MMNKIHLHIHVLGKPMQKFLFSFFSSDNKGKKINKENINFCFLNYILMFQIKQIIKQEIHRN